MKSEPPRMHFQHSAAKIRVFEQNADIIKFWLLGGGGGNFQRKVGSKFTWNSQQILSVASSC